ncbi:MAG: hypothetical protein JO119_17795 [Acidobacteria bacterium]|nr:hypothetical protein [Acidobacteriota bacterium]
MGALFALLPSGSSQRLFAQQLDAAQQATKISKLTSDWLDGKLSTPGANGKLREIARSTQDGKLKVTYNLFVDGAPRDQNYSLLSWPITSAKPDEQMKGLSLNRDGVIVCAGKTSEQCRGEKEDDPVNLTLFPTPGEVVRLALVSSDLKTKIFIGIVPDPIITNSGTCSLEVIRLTPHFELALMRAKGYVDNETLSFFSKSYDESKRQDVKADGEGNFVLALLPFVKGRRHGKTDLSLKGATCAAMLSFEWGE